MSRPYEDLRVRAGSRRWLALRNTGIGASEIAGVLGLSPYTSPTDLYLRKRGVLPDVPDNERMEWGRRLERIILDRFLEDHPGKAVTGRLYRSTRWPWMLATPDALLEPEHAVVEIKTGASRDGWGEPGTDDVPVHYRAQVMQAMDVVGATVAYMPVLLNGRDYRLYRVPYDEVDARILRLRGAEFWQRVQAGQPPAVDHHRATTEALRSAWDVEPARSVQVPAALARKIPRAKALKKRTEALHDRLVNELRAAMGDAAEALDGTTTVATRSAYTQRQVDLDGLRAEAPDLVERHTTQQPRQRLTVKGTA